MTTPIIDAHQHFWDPAGEYDYPWLSGDFAPIRRAFSYPDLEPSLVANTIDGTVLVQSWNSVAETRDYLRIAQASPRVAGVVGWVDLTDQQLDRTLTELKRGEGGRYLVGIRHLLHEEPDPAWITRDDVASGLEVLASHDLAYDLVGKTEHLPGMIKAVQRHPKLRFVLDHIAKPEIKTGNREPWSALMAELGRARARVWCKLSGMITEADWQAWRPADLAPFVAHALASFGPDRCLFGTDWPVCLVAGSYEAVIGALRSALPDLDDRDRAAIFGGNAVAAYRLPEFTR